MRIDNKFPVVMRDDLARWQKSNVASFPARGLGGAKPVSAGEPYVGASWQLYGRLVR
jgi:hypothetical protein